MDHVEQFHLVHRFYRDMWNQFDTSVFTEILEPEITFRGTLGITAAGFDQLENYLETVREAFPDFKNEVRDTVSESNRTFARLLYTGTHKGTLMGIEPTGKHISYEGAALFTFGPAKIRDIWVLGDLHGLLQQLKA